MLQKVVRSTVIDAPIERVWAVLRDFNSHDQWHDVVDEQPHRGRRAQRPGRLRAQLHAEGRQPHPRAAADARPTREHTSHLLHRRGHRAAAALRRHRHAEAGDRRQPHVLALGVDASRRRRARSASCARWWRDGVYEAGFENLRRHLGTARRPARGAARRPRAARRCRCRRARSRRARATAARSSCEPRTARRRRRGAGEVRIRQRAIGVNFIDIYLRRGWIPALLPVSPRPACSAWRRPARCVDVGDGVGTACCPATAWPTSGPMPGAYCERAHRAGRLGGAAARRRSRTRPPRRCCSRASPPTTCCATSAASRAGTRLLVHAAAGGVGLLRVRVGAAPRRDGDRHGVERGQGARRARARLRARDRDARLPLRRRGAARTAAAPT